jgi:predicted Ser/Thr protein kinase
VGEDRTPSRWLIDTAVADMGAAPTAIETHRASRRSAPGNLVERFEELAELGRGGMGRVFTANDRLLGRVVAVKQALSDDVGVLARFARETKIAARLQHPNVLPVLDAGFDDRGRPFFVMNKVDGRSLERAVATLTDVRARLALVGNLAAIVDAVAYAHARGVLHRDIKPPNILLGEYGESLLIDWGIARVLDDPDETDAIGDDLGELTRHGSAMGTPGFMPPEQARGESATRAADVYALGATLYFLLAGKRPFDGLAPTATIATVAADGAPDFAAISDEVPQDLVAIVKRAMAARVEDRYPEAGALAADLRAFLAGQLVAAHRYTVGERLGRWVRKHRLAFAIGTVAAVTTTAVAVVALRNVLAARTSAVAARADAEDRLATLLESLAASDPDYALAKLAELPPSSPVWSHARGVVMTAIHAGASRGLELGSGLAQPIARPDGRELAVIDAGWSAVRFLDPAQQAPATVVPLDVEVMRLAWSADGKTLLALVAKTNDVLAIDRATLATRRLDIGSASDDTQLIGDDLVIVGGALRRLDLAGGPPRELARDVRDAARLDGATLVASATALSVVRDTGEIVHVTPGPTVFGIHASGRRFAYANIHAIIDISWDGTKLTARGDWQVTSRVDRLLYSGDALIAQGRGGLELLEAGGASRMPVERALTVVAAQPDGLYAVAGDQIVWLTPHGAIPLVRGATTFHHVTVAGDYLIAVDRHGTLRSWRRDRLMQARPLPMPDFENVAGAADDQLLLAGTDERGVRGAWRYATDTLESTRLAYSRDADMGGSTFRCPSQGRWLVHARNAWERPAPLFRSGADNAAPLGITVRAVLGCSEQQVALLTPDGVELRSRTDPTQLVSRLPARDVRGAAFAAGRVLLYRADGTFELFDRTGRSERSHRVDDVSAFALDEGGDVLYASGGALSLWRAAGPKPLAFDASNIKINAIGAEHGRFLVRGTTTRWADSTDTALLVDRDGTVVRMANASGAPQLANARVATTSANGTVTISDLTDGTTLRLVMPTFQDYILLTEHALVAISKARGLVRVVPLDDVPRDPAALRAFVLAHSNARVEPGATFASFPPAN